MDLKLVVVVAIYNVYVPENADIDKISIDIENQIKNRTDGLCLDIEDEDSYPDVELTSVQCGTHMSLSIG